MLDLKQLDEEYENQLSELASKCLRELIGGKEVNILKLIPEDSRKKLKDGYIHWIPPGNRYRAKEKFIGNLAWLFSSYLRPRRILAPLIPCPDKASFTDCYGLSEELGLTYKDFLKLVKDGDIILYADKHLTKYTPSFYREIFKACENQGYLPSHFPPYVRCTMCRYSLAKITLQKDIDTLEFLKKHKEWDPNFVEEEAKRYFRDWKEKISHIIWGKSGIDVVKDVASRVLTLRAVGFEALTNVVLKLAEKDPVKGYSALFLYDEYLISPCCDALLGQIYYDLEDLEAMAFLKIFQNFPPEDISIASPASLRLVCKPFKASMVTMPIRDELSKFIEGSKSEKELINYVVSFQYDAQEYDIDGILNNYRRLSEVVEERINQEHAEWFKRSKRVKAFAYIGFGLTAVTGVNFYWHKLHWMLKEIPYMYPFLPEALKKTLRAVKFTTDKISRWLVKKWPFVEKGLPFVLWKYDIPPHRYHSERENN